MAKIHYNFQVWNGINEIAIEVHCDPDEITAWPGSPGRIRICCLLRRKVKEITKDGV